MAMRAKSSFLGDTRVGDEHDDSGVLLALHLPGGTRQARQRSAPRSATACGVRSRLAHTLMRRTSHCFAVLIPASNFVGVEGFSYASVWRYDV